MMKFILQKETPRECNHNHDCDNCTTHECSDTMLVSKSVSQEEYVAALLKVIDDCNNECDLVGDDLQGDICILNYMSKAESHLRKINSGEYPDSTFKFVI